MGAFDRLAFFLFFFPVIFHCFAAQHLILIRIEINGDIGTRDAVQLRESGTPNLGGTRKRCFRIIVRAPMAYIREHNITTAAHGCVHTLGVL